MISALTAYFRSRPLLGLAVLLITGEAAAFALAPPDGVETVSLAMAVMFLMAAVGWKSKILALTGLVAIGFTLATLTECSRRRTVFEIRRSYFRNTLTEFTVTGDAVECVSNKGRRRIVFNAKKGPLVYRVSMPCDSECLPRTGDELALRGATSYKESKKGRYASKFLWVNSSDDMKVIERAEVSSYRIFMKKANEWMSCKLSRCFADDRSAAVANAIFLGRKDGFDGDLKRSFADSGTMHVFAISGLHVMLMAKILLVVISSCGIGRSRAPLFVMPLLFAYVGMTGSHPSAVRALMMCVFYFTGIVLNRQGNAINAWSLTAIVVCAGHPELLFDVGCVLSFVVMLALVVWSEWSRNFSSVTQWLESKARQMNACACGIDIEKERRKAKYVHFIAELCDFVLGSMAVSIVAWVAGVPIIASVFGVMTPVGLVVNTMMVLLASLEVNLIVMTLVFSFIWFPFCVVFGAVAGAVSHLMICMSEYASRVPYGNFAVEEWSMNCSLIWYSAFLLILYLLGQILPKKSYLEPMWWK